MNNGLSEVYCINPEGRIHYYTKGYVQNTAVPSGKVSLLEKHKPWSGCTLM